jgi:hypothetical protein
MIQTMTNSYQFHEFKEMNNSQTICGKMSLQFNNWIIISRFFHGSRTLNFDGQFQYKSMSIHNLFLKWLKILIGINTDF